MLDDDEVPAFLKIAPDDRKTAWAQYEAQRKENAMKVGPKEQALRDLREKRPFDQYEAEHKERKLAKARGRIAKMKAKLSGEAAKLPPTGKEALAVIAAARDDEPTASAAAEQQETAMTKTPTKKTTKRKSPATKKPRAKKAPKTAAAKADGGVRAGSKLAMIAGLLTRPEGCITKDVLEATGWPAVSMPQQAKAAGLTLRTEKEGRVTRYFGAAAA